MIKDLIVSKLNQYVSQYVENINPDNITYSLFEGKGELRDLKLKPAALIQLLTIQLGKELPIEVKAGYVDFIKIQIPLSNLFRPGSEGMRLELDGLNVLLGPVTDRPYDKERDEELQHAIKTAKLQAFETSAVEIVSEEAKKNPTLFERMGKYILNNIQIKVSNIHIRYEDSVTNDDYSFAVGTILKSLHVVTTDDKWQEAELDSSAKVLHKLGKLTDFSVYWNHYVKDPDLVGKKQRIKTEEWRRLMRTSVSTYKIKEESFQPILEPVSAEAKIIMNNQDDLQMPKLYIQFSLPEFESVFSRHQYMNLLKWIDSTTRMQVNQRYRKYQPNMPVPHNAKRWWQYAITAVLEEYIRPYSWQSIFEHSQKAKRYKDLYKRHLEHPDNTAYSDVLDHVEMSLDITSIMAARGKAKAEIRQQVAPPQAKMGHGGYLPLTNFFFQLGKQGSQFAAEAPERAKRKKKDKSSGGWFSWIWGSEEEDDEDITIDQETDLLSSLSSEERKELYSGIGYDENAEKESLPKEYVAYKIQFEMKKCSATLMNYSKPILQVALSDMLTSYENRPGGEGARVLSNTESFTIEGASVDYNLVSLLTSNGGIYTSDNQMFTLDYELRPLTVNADQSLKLNVRPVEIVYDEHALSQVLMFFQVPEESGKMDVGSIARKQIEGVMKYSRDTLLYAIEQKSTFHISVHMRSPYIVIPQKGTLHSGGNILVVDFGKLDVQSELQDKVSEVQNESITELESRLYDKFMVKVTDVKVLIADSGDDWHLKQTTENSKYHILPSTGFVVAFHKTVIPDNYQIPHHKFDARLQTLEVNMTDEQLLILYSFIYNFPMPNASAPLTSYMDRPGSQTSKLVPSEVQLEPDIGSLRRLKNNILKRPVISLEDVEEEEEEEKKSEKKKTVRVVSSDIDSYLSASEDSEDDKKKSERFQKVKSVDDFLSQNVKMKMLIRVQLGELLVQLSLEQNKKTLDYMMFRLDRIEANMASLVYTGSSVPSSCGAAFHAIVGGIRMADKLHTGASGAYLELLKTEAQNELISISYRQITPDCPDFKTKYDSIEHGASMTFHNMSVIFDQTGICYLKKFLNDFQERLESLEVKEDLPLSPPPQAVLRRTDSQSSSLASRAIDLSKRLSSVMENVDRVDGSSPGTRLHLISSMENLCLHLANKDTDIAEMQFIGMQCQVLLKPKKTTMDLQLKEFNIQDLTKDTLYPNILTIESKDSPFFDMKVEQFKDNNINPRGRRKSRTELPLDYVIRMRVGNLQFAYINKFIFEIMRFFEPMKSPEITEAAAVAMETVTKQVAEIHPTSLAIGVVIDMHIPTVIVPKHSKSPDLFFVKFGNLRVSSAIKTTELENGLDQKWNDFTATLTSMQVSRGKLMNEQFVVMHHVVEPLNFKASLSLALHPFHSDVIYDISGDLDLVKVNLKQTDIRLMMSILRMNLNEGAPTSPRDAVTPTLEDPVPDQGMSTVDATNVTIVPPEESNCYNAIVTMQGLVVCLYEEVENTKVLSDRSLMPILSKFEIGKFEIRANTYSSGEDKMDVNVSLHTMSIDDVRPDSSIATKRIFFCTRDTVKVAETEEELLPLISVIYKVKANDNQEADIRMEKVTLNVHVPYLLALYNFYVAALGSDTEDVRTLSRLTSVTSTSSEGETTMDAPLRPPQTSIRVFGTIKEPEIVLFGDPDKNNSRILVFEADIEFDLQNDAVEQKIRSKVKDMKMYCSSYGSETKSKQWVIQPTTVDFDRRMDIVSNHCQYNISIKELDLYVSPSVLQLMVNVQDMVKTEESKPMEDSSFTDTSMEINLWTVASTSSEKWLSKIDESGEAPNPLTPRNLPSETLNLSVEKINAYFRVRNQDHHVDLLHIYSSVEVDAHDWSKQFHMTGEIQLKSSFFNEKLSVWESLIEPVSEKEGLYRPWEGVIKMIRGRSYPMLFNYIQDDFNMEECLRNDVQQMLHKSKRRSSSSESETDSSTEMTVLRSKETRKRSRIASDKSYESLKQGSIQGESDTEPDGLIQSITNKLGGIFSDDSSEDADVSDTDENDDTFDPSLDKPVFLTPKGPIQVSRDQGFDEVDAPLGDVIESEEEDYPQSLYLILASQDRLLLNVTPQALSVLRDVTEAMTQPAVALSETVKLPAFELKNKLGIHTTVTMHPDLKVHKENILHATLLRHGIDTPTHPVITGNKTEDEKELNESETDGLLSNVLGGIGHIALSAGAFVFDDDDDYLSGEGIDRNRMKIQVDGFDLSSTILHKRACRRLLSLAPEKPENKKSERKNSTKYWYVLDIDVWHGRKVINILSPLKVCNNLTVDIDVYCKTEDLKQYKVDEVTMETGPYTKLATIVPGEEYYVPLFLAYHCDVFVCPSSLPYRVHRNGIWWKDILLTKEKSKTYGCLSNMDDKSFNVKVLCKEGQRLIPPQDVPKGVPYYTLDVRPPVRIHNYLPYDLQFSLEGSGSFSSLLHGESTALHTVDLTESYKLHISIQDYLGCDWTGMFDVSQDQEEFKAVAMSPYDFSTEENHNKHLALSIHSSQTTALDLYVYSPYWIINKTDLPIQLRGSNSDAVFDCSPQQAAPLLFRFKKNRRKKAKVKVYNSKWSQSFSMDTVGNSGVVICHDKERKKKYRLMLQFQWSYLKLTRIVTITPFFLVVNKSSQNLWYMEEDEATDLWLELKMGQCAPYWPVTDTEKMFVKYDDSTVVSEHFPVNIPHNTVLRMEHGSALCVEVIGGLENPRTITFSDYDIGDAPVRVENLCDDVFIVIHQKSQHQMTVLSQNESILYTWDDPTDARKLMWNVYGRSPKQDSEIDINKDSYNLTQLSVKYVQASGTYNYKDSVDGSKLDSSPEDDSDVGDTVDGSTSLKTKSVKMTIYWVSFLDGQQRVIIFTTDERVARATRMAHVSGLGSVKQGLSPKMNEGEQASLVSVLSLDSIMLSVISEYYKEVALVTVTSAPAIWEIEVKAKWKLLEDVTLVTWLEDKWIHGVTQDSLEDRIEVDFSKMQMTKPYMGELRRKCPPGLFLQYRQSPHQTFVHLKVQKVQIDNQLYDAYYQTVLNSYPTPVSLLKRQGPKPFIEFGMIRRMVPENHVDTFRQLQLIVQEFNIQLDWGFIESMQDVFADLMPTQESESERLKQDILISQKSLKEISSVMSAGSSHRIFFETMKISPMKIHVSFSMRGNPHLTRDVPPSLASDIKEFLRNSIGATFTEVKDIELKMALFEVRGSSMTVPKMSSQLLAHYRQQLFLQFYVVIFGLDVLGNPYGLFKDILQGIGEFFYDPILDTIQGEDGISDNMMRGFQSAMGHIVGGTANSVARITGSLGNAFAYLSFDEDFQRRRRRRLQQQPPDLPHSLAMAGKGFLSGIRFGLSGIVLDPLQGASEEGVEGFFKGLGKGLLGLITQPIGGVLDMVSLAFDGVRRSAEFEGGVVFRMRLPRFINRYKGLEPYSAYKARGNYLLYSIKDGQFTESEIFINFAPLSHEERADLLFITTKHLLYLEKSRFVSGYGLEWKVELSSILGVPKLLEGEKKLIITLKDKCGTMFSDNRVEITSVDADILKWVQGKIEKVLSQRIYV